MSLFSPQGGNNAGHTVKVGGVVYDFHLLPRYALSLLAYVSTPVALRKKCTILVKCVYMQQFLPLLSV